MSSKWRCKALENFGGWGRRRGNCCYLQCNLIGNSNFGRIKKHSESHLFAILGQAGDERVSPDQGAIGAVPTFDITFCMILIWTSTVAWIFYFSSWILILSTKYSVRNFATSMEQPSLWEGCSVQSVRSGLTQNLSVNAKTHQCRPILTDPC